MEWYWILLIAAGGVVLLALLYTILATIVAKGTLKAATTPVAHTIEEARSFQTEYEGMDYVDYDTVWRKRNFEVDGTRGKLRGEVIFNDAVSDRVKVAIICHGHTWNHITSLKYARIFYAEGFNVVIYDHAYFGLSDGEFTTLGYYERQDLSSVIDYARVLFGEDAFVALHGESMGAVTVLCELSMRSDIDAVIADCAFSDTFLYFRQLCLKATRLPGFPIVDISNIMSKRKFGYDFASVSPIEDVRRSDVPICFIHGAKDRFIRPEHSRNMYAAARNPLSELHLVPNAGHARSYHADNAAYTRIVSDFIRKVIDGRGNSSDAQIGEMRQ